MQVKAQLNYLRIAPRKMRLLADVIRGKTTKEAKTLLDFHLKKGAIPLRKVLESAIANAKNSFQLEEEDLFISKIAVDEGPKLKRWRARSRGRAARIEKKTSHIILVLEGGEMKKTKPAKEAPKEAIEYPSEKKEVKPEEERRKPQQLSSRKKEKTGDAYSKKLKTGLKKVFRRKSF